MPKKLLTEEFITKAVSRYGDRYNYDKVVYIRSCDKVCIVCPIHGEFMQRPNDHLNGYGCQKCGNISIGDKLRDGKTLFVKKANEVHGIKYIYDNVIYIKSNTCVNIVCPIHGEFWQTPSNHIAGHGCPQCASVLTGDARRKTTEEFLTGAIAVHGDYYNYNKAVYITAGTRVKIICPVHGEFMQTPRNHLKGRGCPRCSASIGEHRILDYLHSRGIIFVYQYTQHTCKVKQVLPFDFAVFLSGDYKTKPVLIEFDGEQHFMAIDRFGGEEKYQKTQEYDKIKNEYCLTNNIKLIRIPYTEMENINSILDRELKIEG